MGTQITHPVAEYLAGVPARCARGLSAPVGANVRGWGICPVEVARVCVVEVESPGAGASVAPGGAG